MIFGGATVCGTLNALMRHQLAMSVAGAVLGASACSASLETPVDGWVVVATEHVLLRTELPASSALKLANELQNSRDAFASGLLRCAFERDSGPIEVTALPPNQFKQLARPGQSAYFRSYGAAWLDYRPQIVVPTTFDGTSRQVYQHELTHRLDAVCFPNAPVWLDEGLAALLETALVDDSRLSVGLPTYLIVPARRGFNFGYYQGMQVQTVPRDYLPSVWTLLGLSHNEFYPSSEGEEHLKRSAGNYAAAWSLVHLLVLGDPDLGPRFSRYLGALHSRSRSPDQAFRDEFRDIDLDARLAAYLGRARLPYVDLDYRATPREKPRIRSMTRGEADVHWSWLLGSRHRNEALSHASAALTDPASAAMARAMAASIHAETDQLVAAEAEIDKGLQSSPDDARLLHAKLELELYAWKGFRGRTLDQTTERLRAVASTAIQLNALGKAELERGDAEAALEYSRRALAERPECWTCLVTEAQALARLSRWPEALSSLELAARWIAHDDPDALKQVVDLARQIRREAGQR